MGFEPTTSDVTGRRSNRAELRPRSNHSSYIFRSAEQPSLRVRRQFGHFFLPAPPIQPVLATLRKPRAFVHGTFSGCHAFMGFRTAAPEETNSIIEARVALD